jgi:orotidine-5'-phosphate decarboxylase
MINNIKIFVALDYSDETSARRLINLLSPSDCGVKIGKELFTAAGPKIVEYAQKKGFEVFLDLKYHDIPNTVKKACQSAARLGVYMVNVHALGGSEMMIAAKEGLTQSKAKTLLIGVTLLTSHDQKNLHEMGVTKNLEDEIAHLATNVAKCGLDGVVCSANDIKFLKPSLPKNFHFVTPGIRPIDSSNDDQKRITTPEDALASGSTMLVIGRPITHSSNPYEALKAIRRTL